MPDPEKPDDFQRLLAEEMAKLVPQPPAAGAELPRPMTVAEYCQTAQRVELAALELAWRLLPPILNLPGAVAQRGAWVDHAEFLARYLRKRLGMNETPPPGSGS